MREITSPSQLNQCLEASKESPVFIFKHSTRCPISSAANARVTAYEEKHGSGAPPIYLVNVVESRDVSNEVASKLDVQHQSPQLLLVKDGQALWSASHHGINEERMEEAAGGNGG